MLGILPWDIPSKQDYDTLAAESEYAGCCWATGQRPQAGTGTWAAPEGCLRLCLRLGLCRAAVPGTCGARAWLDPPTQPAAAPAHLPAAAAWVLVNGFSLNHTTIAVHGLAELEGGINQVGLLGRAELLWGGHSWWDDPCPPSGAAHGRGLLLSMGLAMPHPLSTAAPWPATSPSPKCSPQVNRMLLDAGFLLNEDGGLTKVGRTDGLCRGGIDWIG